MVYFAQLIGVGHRTKRTKLQALDSGNLLTRVKIAKRWIDFYVGSFYVLRNVLCAYLESFEGSVVMEGMVYSLFDNGTKVLGVRTHEVRVVPRQGWHAVTVPKPHPSRRMFPGSSVAYLLHFARV
ncbi:hypothetical protein GW17_00052881 [Ensete ventricosum]|nr:hypothetical protein GW17_00052881 [Ensete ventricosum]